MTICSLQSVGGIKFGSSRSALSVFGTPLRESVNRRGEQEIVFANAIYRFMSDKLVEISFQTPVKVEINGQEVAGSSIVDFLKQQDPSFREVYGFAIAPSLGLAVDTEHENPWVTAFIAGGWDHIK